MDIIPDNKAYSDKKEGQQAENTHPALTVDEINQFKERLLFQAKKKRIGEVEQEIKNHPQKFDIAIVQYSNNKDSEHAIKLINKYNKDPQNYPELLDRLRKKSLRWSLNTFGWEKNELRLQNKPIYMALVAEDIFYQNKREEAVYLVSKYNLFPLLTKQELKSFIQNNVSKEQLQTIKTTKFNKYLEIDDFEPMEIFFEKPGEHELPYCRLSDYNITFNDVIWIDSHDAWLKHLPDMKKAPVIGIDMECIPAFIKWEDEVTALMQVATHEKIYFFDFQSKDWEFKIFVEFFDEICANGDIVKLGLALKADMKNINWPKIETEDETKKYRLFRSYFDVAKVYKELTYDKKSNLAHLTEKVLEKRLSKFEQVNDWDSRPFRKTQSHYAALDSYVLLKLYEELLKKANEEYDKDDMIEVFQC